MNQEQKIEKAKLCGLCLSALLLSLFALIWAIWTDAALLLLVFTLGAFTFFLYQALVMDAYSIFTYALIKYLKCSRLHRFLEEKKKKSALYQLWEITDSHQPVALHRYDEVAQREGRTESNQFKDQGTEVSDKKPMRLYMNKDKVKIRTTGRVPDLHGEKNSDKFEAANKQYKESTLRLMQEKGINKQRLEQICMLVKSNYSNKVKQLLDLSEENQKAIIALAEEQFEIKVVAADQKVPQKLQPVLMDDLLNRLRAYQLTHCLPWTPRSPEDQAQKKVTQALKELVEWRLKIDDTLCPYAQLNAEARVKLVDRLRRQIQDKAERDLVFVLAGLFNENIKGQEYKLKVKMMGEEVPGIQIIQSWVGECYHLDLQVTPKDTMSKVYHVKPGEDNVWFALGIAAELYRLKI